MDGAHPRGPCLALPQPAPGDLLASAVGLIQSIAKALGPEGESAPLKEHLTDLAVRRLTLGFPIGTVVQALLLGKEVLAPYLLEAYEHNPEATCASMALLDACVREAAVYLSNRYAEEMDLRLREEQDRAVRNACQLATLEERERLAGEMHDRLAQALGYLNLGLSSVDDLLARGEVDDARWRVAELKQAAKQTYTDVREAIFNLRIRSDAQTLFLPTLQEYLAEYRNRYGVCVDLVVEDEGLTQFPPEVRIQVLRIIQEALTNVRKHAGTDRAQICIQRAEEKVRICINDEGRGFDLARVTEGSEEQFFGLQIMHERAKAAGGTLDIQSAPGQGTRIVLDVPFPGLRGREGVSPVEPLRILLADDHVLFRKGLAALLGAWKGIKVVGEASTGEEAIILARQTMPDVVLMDIRMPGLSGLEATRQIKREMPHVRIVILTVSDEDEDLFAAIKSGADGYLLKDLEPRQLCETLEGLRHGEAPISGILATRILAEFRAQEARPVPPETVEELTEREKEVLQWVAKGASNREIAEALCVSENTVKIHLRNILEKLHLRNRIQAAVYAVREGLAAGPSPEE